VIKKKFELKHTKFYSTATNIDYCGRAHNGKELYRKRHCYINLSELLIRVLIKTGNPNQIRTCQHYGENEFYNSRNFIQNNVITLFYKVTRAASMVIKHCARAKVYCFFTL